MEKDLSLKDLVNDYCKISENLKNKYIEQKVRSEKYIPFLYKCQLADKIVNSYCLDKDGHIHIDSTYKYLLYIMYTIDIWTNLTVNFNNIYNEYDMLMINNLIDPILSIIPSEELVDFDEIINRKYDDFIINHTIK